MGLVPKRPSMLEIERDKQPSRQYGMKQAQRDMMYYIKRLFTPHGQPDESSLSILESQLSKFKEMVRLSRDSQAFIRACELEEREAKRYTPSYSLDDVMANLKRKKR
jgi:hypothetical protein